MLSRVAFHLGLALGLVAFSVRVVAAVNPAPPAGSRYRIVASLSATPPQVQGVVEIHFTNHSRRTLDEAVLFLFPNRFSVPGPGINDFNRPFVYPDEDFHPGSMKILDARDGEAEVTVEPVRAPGLPEGTAIQLPIAPLPPGDSRNLRLRFQTVVPRRFGTFGTFDGEITMVGGWYPYLAPLAADGSWRLHAPPPLADFSLRLRADATLEVIAGGHFFARGAGVDLSLPSRHFVSVIAAPEFLRTSLSARAVLYQRPTPRAWRIGWGATPSEALRASLREIVAKSPELVPPPAGQLAIVEAPLRLNLTAPAEGAVVISDRSFEVHPVLRPFHELQLAQAVYEELLRPQLSERESPDDFWWVSEGLSRVLAQRYIAKARPGTRSVHDWIQLFDIFAIVDRFETAPKIPFVGAFFQRARIEDPLHGRVTTFNRSLPPGRVILGKLRAVVGASEFDRIVDDCTDATRPFRQCAEKVADRDLDWLFAEWLQPYPLLNYDFASVDLNQPAAGGFRSQLTVRRESSRPIREPVTVRLRTIGGRDVDLRWNGEGGEGHLADVTPSRVCQAVIDPNRVLIEDRRDDDYHPASLQVILDTAQVEVSSTEFGISGLVVGRRRYDYRKDIAMAGFYTNRSIGLTMGGRLHWGTPNDATTYRHNIYGFYGFQALDGSFSSKSRPGVRTSGQLASLGVRYDYTNLFAFDNPTHERNLRIYADWYDRALGGDYSYADWGFSAVGTHPLWTYRVIAAGEVTNGFSEPLSGSLVPNQGLYSLGGSRSIRGIGAEEKLGRNIFIARGELRYDVFPEVDLNAFDLAVLRRGQLRLFVDSGDVSNSAGRVYDPSHYAVGVGIAAAGVYDFLGFFPSLAYVAVATRVDRASSAGDIQFLFGTRQAF